MSSQRDLKWTQSTENCEDNVSLSDELTPESETRVEFCDEDKVKKFEMEKEFAPPYSYYSKLQEYLGIDYQKINSLDGKNYQCSKCGKQFKNMESCEKMWKPRKALKKHYEDMKIR